MILVSVFVWWIYRSSAALAWHLCCHRRRLGTPRRSRCAGWRGLVSTWEKFPWERRCSPRHPPRVAQGKKYPLRVAYGRLIMLAICTWCWTLVISYFFLLILFLCLLLNVYCLLVILHICYIHNSRIFFLIQEQRILGGRLGTPTRGGWLVASPSVQYNIAWLPSCGSLFCYCNSYICTLH